MSSKYRSSIACAGILVLLPFLVSRLGADATAVAPVSDFSTLKLEVDALSALNDLQLSPDQMAALRSMAVDTAAAADVTDARGDEQYMTTLRTARKALLAHNQADIDKIEDQLDDLEGKRDPDADPDFQHTVAANNKAADLVKILTPKQVVRYLSQNEDDLTDPTDSLLHAIRQAQSLSDDDFANLREDVSEDIGVMVAGTVSPRTAPIARQSARLLMRARKLSPEDFKAQEPALEAEARKLTAGLDPIPCIRHWLESEMAELLSNPSLDIALKDWQDSEK